MLGGRSRQPAGAASSVAFLRSSDVKRQQRLDSYVFYRVCDSISLLYMVVFRIICFLLLLIKLIFSFS